MLSCNKSIRPLMRAAGFLLLLMLPFTIVVQGKEDKEIKEEEEDFCSICPDKSEVGNPDNIVHLIAFNGEEATCQEADEIVTTTVPTSSPDCGVVRRQAYNCGCPNVQATCSLCPIGYEVTEKSLELPGFQISGQSMTCEQASTIATTVEARSEDCTNLQSLFDFCGCSSANEIIVDLQPVTDGPSTVPTALPTVAPTVVPTTLPTIIPTTQPTITIASNSPTSSSNIPTWSPSVKPSPLSFISTTTDTPTFLPTTSNDDNDDDGNDDDDDGSERTKTTDEPSTRKPKKAPSPEPTSKPLKKTQSPVTDSPSTRKPEEEDDDSNKEQETQELPTAEPSATDRSPKPTSKLLGGPSSTNPSEALKTSLPSFPPSASPGKTPTFDSVQISEDDSTVNGNSGNNNSKTAVILLGCVIGVGGTIILAVLGIWLYSFQRRRMKTNMSVVAGDAIEEDKKNQNESNNNLKKFSTSDINHRSSHPTSSNTNSNSNPYGCEIFLEPDSDVSTLGDPIGPYGDHITVDDDTTGTSELHTYYYKHSLLAAANGNNNDDDGGAMTIEESLEMENGLADV